MEENVTLLAAFGAGLLSFISPCVLPLIPGYLSYISGLSLDEMRGAPVVAGGGCGRRRAGPRRPRARSCSPRSPSSSGFRSSSSRSAPPRARSASFWRQRQAIFNRIAGAVIIIFGLHTMGVLRIEWLYQEKRVQTSRKPGGIHRRRTGRRRLRVRLDAVHRPDPRGHSRGRWFAGHVSAGRAPARRCTRSGLGVPFLATALMIDRFFAAHGTHPPSLPQDRARLGRSAGRRSAC